MMLCPFSPEIFVYLSTSVNEARAEELSHLCLLVAKDIRAEALILFYFKK